MGRQLNDGSQMPKDEATAPESVTQAVCTAREQMTPYNRRKCTNEEGKPRYLHQQHNCKNDEKQKPKHVWEIRLVRVLTCCPHSRNKKMKRARINAMYKCATTAEEDAPTTTDGQAKRYCQKAISEKSIVWDRTCEMHHVFSEEVQFRTNTNDGVVTTDIEPKKMNRQPMSAVQPVFEQTPWQKERLTHSQPREQPRHRKETQPSWMKLNIDIARLNIDVFFHFFATDA